MLTDEYIKKGKNGTFKARMVHYMNGKYCASISKLTPLFWDGFDHIITDDEEEARTKYEEYRKQVDDFVRGEQNVD